MQQCQDQLTNQQPFNYNDNQQLDDFPPQQQEQQQPVDQNPNQNQQINDVLQKTKTNLSYNSFDYIQQDQHQLLDFDDNYDSYGLHEQSYQYSKPIKQSFTPGDEDQNIPIFAIEQYFDKNVPLHKIIEQFKKNNIQAFSFSEEELKNLIRAVCIYDHNQQIKRIEINKSIMHKYAIDRTYIKNGKQQRKMISKRNQKQFQS